MNMRITLGAATVLLAAAALTGCAPDTGDGGTSGPTGDPYEAPMEEPTTAAADTVSLTTAENDLGTIVVDGEGMVIYQFDSDTQGEGVSTCEGQCLDAWPPVHGDASVSVEGITGEIGSITGVDGEPQLTLNGWPLYYFAGDTEPGMTEGQGVNEVWWVLTPEGEPIRE
jgi:predicted lipoprotein with Yx(FWY)xxD motif